jgi:hypothetical protein
MKYEVKMQHRDGSWGPAKNAGLQDRDFSETSEAVEAIRRYGSSGVAYGVFVPPTKGRLAARVSVEVSYPEAR